MIDQTIDITAENFGIDWQQGVIDWSILEAYNEFKVPGKPDPARKLIEVYLSSSTSLIESVAAAVTASDGQALMQAAHTLKSSSFTIGAMLLGKMCSELEQLGRANTLENAPALLNRAENEFAAVCSLLRAALE